ncbi:MAG: acyl-CoA thioesterase [Gammaproteobacteria bacterium]
MTGSVFTTRIPVRFEHVDMAGIVFYPRYFEMINQAVENWFAEALACPFRQLHGEMRLGIPTTHFDVHFDAPSRIGDELEFALTLPQLGNTSFTLDHTVTCNGESRLRIRQRLVCVTLDGIRPVRIPSDVRERMSRYLQSTPHL